MSGHNIDKHAASPSQLQIDHFFQQSACTVSFLLDVAEDRLDI